MNSYEQKLSHQKKPNKVHIQSKNEFIPHEKPSDAYFISKLSPIKAINIDKFEKQEFSLNNQISTMDTDLLNKSCEARVRRYALKKSSANPDPMFNVKPQPPSKKAQNITSISNNDSINIQNSIHFFSQQSSIDSSIIQNSLNGSSIRSTDNSLLDNSLLNSQKKSQRSIKSMRKLKLSSNQIWLNMLREGINNLNSTDRNSIHKSNPISIKVRDNEQKESNINTNFRNMDKNLRDIKLDKFEQSTDSNDCKSIEMLKPLINLKCSNSIVSNDHDRAVSTESDINCSQNSLLITRRNIKNRNNTDLLNKIRDKMATKMRSQNQNDRSEIENSSIHHKNASFFEPSENDRKEILIAKNYIEAPLPNSKRLLKVLSDENYSNTIEKLQKTKHLFSAFKSNCQEYNKQFEKKKQKKSEMKENFDSSNHILQPKINNNMIKKSNDIKDSLLLINNKYNQLREKNIRIGINIIFRVLKKNIKPYLSMIITYQHKPISRHEKKSFFC